MLSVLRNDRISSDLNVSMYQCHLSQLTDLSTKATNPRQTEVVQVGTRQCWVSSKLQLTRKIQCLKYRLTGNYTNLLQQNTAMTKFFPSLQFYNLYFISPKFKSWKRYFVSDAFRQQKSAKKGPQKYLIRRSNPISVILSMDVPLIRKTTINVFYGEIYAGCFLKKYK